MAQGVHDGQEAGAGFVKDVYFSFLIASIEERVRVIQGAQLDVEGSGVHGQKLDFGVIKFSVPGFVFFCAVFHISDDVFTDEAYGFLQVTGEVVECSQGHHAGR